MKLNEVETVNDLGEYIMDVENYREEDFGGTENFLNALEDKCSELKNVDWKVKLYRLIDEYEYEHIETELGQSWVEYEDLIAVPHSGKYVVEIQIPENSNVVVFDNYYDGMWEYIVPNAYKYNPTVKEFDEMAYIDEGLKE